MSAAPAEPARGVADRRAACQCIPACHPGAGQAQAGIHLSAGELSEAVSMLRHALVAYRAAVAKGVRVGKP